MIKKTLIYFILILFSTNVAAAELIMKCGDYTYKYIEDSAGDRVDYKHPKGTKNKYKEWCAEKRDNVISREGYSRIIKDHKATCLVGKMVYKYKGKTMTRSNSVSVSNFDTLIRTTELYHSNTGSKKNTKDFKCKKRKR